jgi:type II secretory pathway component GspD/PulD (secretin)
MRSAPPGTMFLTIGLFSLTLMLGIGRAAPAPADDKARPSSSADKIRKELDRAVTLDVDQQPLALAISQVQELTKINFVLDRVTLAQSGIDPDQLTVSLKLKDIKARSALRSLLTPYNLNYAILGDTVLISTDEVAMLRQVRQRVSIDLDKVELNKALKRLARETGTNLVVDPRVSKDAQTAVTLQMEDVPLETAVRLMAEMVNLKPVRVGNTLFVTSKANAGELRNDPDLQPAPMPNNGNERVIINGAVVPGAAPAVAPAAPPPPAPGAKPAEEKSDKPAEEKSDKSEKPEKPNK